ncbi:copper amine oxidase N-terminal domain-containing protein [Candidatus Cryosericum hinesii]|jgi:hypothetical protein|uniref:Copper amine oxidase N-terminal domain-containing protein n=1 Tax=Candidatus Cryosericum hinesii TaxID=2290915 RepID=A0A398DCG7_9BACT|nr:copper amine oxidase N-terminal domain-containing protein [Candidatus Cryosericum hinesii]RIE10206.1 copper amine oxidase N-terminal domain-containing protein [Candidatus Cryosericum hinesii]RIE12193.1 copper amine oxidase N-terminal domain-containing protein [Candidatus Cryosericum hinesii]RIE12327.1 copper amine oxidase N-terminal domain-containing protein [Candidatus Cryosericum hinesii]
MRKFLSVVVALVVLSVFCLPSISHNMSTVLAGSPSWVKIYGGAGGDEARSVVQLADGGMLVTGVTSSFGEGKGLLVVKLNAAGSVVWTKTFSDVVSYNTACAVETKSGEIAIAATSSSEDVLFIKLNSKGNVLIQKTYGGDGKDWPTQIIQTSDGGFVIAGNTTSFSEGQGQGLILKIDASGSIKWATALSEVDTDNAVSVCESGDKGIVVAASTTTIGAGDVDILVCKLTSSGGLGWTKTFGGSAEDVATSIASASGTDCVVAGYTSSLGAGNDDCLAMRINSSGGVVWSNTYGTGYNEEWYGMTKARDGGFVVTGVTLGFDAKNEDVFLAKLNAGGAVQWAETFKGDNEDHANAVTQTADSGFVAVGITKSFTSFDKENYDFLVIKTDSSGGISGSSKYHLFSADLQAATAKLTASTAGIKRSTVSVAAAKASSQDSIPKLLSATICGGSQTIVTLQINNPKMTVNGTEQAIDEQGTKPIIKNNRTLVPIRAIIESLGGTIAWDATAKKVTLALGSTTMQLWIGNSTAKVNGKDIPIDKDDAKVVPEIINSRTMIPLRFVAENLGCDVLWDAATKTVTIKYPKS